MTFSPDFFRRCQRFNAPGALLVLLLQRTPVVRVIAVADEMVLTSPVGAILRSTAAAAAASLGALHTLAGATEFIINRNPVTGTVGQSLQPPVSFTYNGTPSSPASFRVTGPLPPGLQFIPAIDGDGVVNSGTPVIVGTPTQAGSFQIDVQGFNSTGGTGLTNDIQVSISFTISGGTTTSPPVFTIQPANQPVATGGTAVFSVAASGSPTLQWQRNGVTVSGATNSNLSIPNVQPGTTGIYYAVASNSSGTVTSQAAILGATSTAKLVGAGTEFPDIFHAGTGFTYDQILLEGAAASVTADAGQILRMSFIDLNDDIVQVEFSGPGTLSLVLDGISGPAAPIKYNQAVTYMKGHAGIVLVGATVNTHLSVFSVGRANAANQALFNNEVTYDGLADIAFIAITSADGKFGGLRAANASLFATRGLTGVYARNVEFTGPVFVGDINASDQATPVLQIGSGSDVRITGGDLFQANGKAVQVQGVAQLKFTAGSTSHGTLFPAKTNQAVLEQNGVNVTSQVVVNP